MDSVNNTNNSENVKETLGQKLRRLTQTAKVNKEYDVLIEILENAANGGNDSIKFNDLREFVPNAIMDNSLWQWLENNEISCTGRITEVGAYEYVLAWN